jgi:hypothetical protein
VQAAKWIDGYLASPQLSQLTKCLENKAEVIVCIIMTLLEIPAGAWIG